MYIALYICLFNQRKKDLLRYIPQMLHLKVTNNIFGKFYDTVHDTNIVTPHLNLKKKITLYILDNQIFRARPTWQNNQHVDGGH